MFHVLKYLDIAICILIAGYASYEFLWAWAHDERTDTRLLTKLFGWSLSEKEIDSLDSLGFTGIMFGVALLFVAGIFIAAAWPISIPALVIWGIAWHIRSKIRSTNKEKVDV